MSKYVVTSVSNAASSSKTVAAAKASGVAAALALAAAVAGCASYDRMSRMSGGIIDEYTAPKSFRLRSKKYQAKTQALQSAAHADNAAATLGGIDDAPVNVWPFFFMSKNYWSVLWPLMDCDEYGFAFRPFINIEGDDRSILFPLSAWNISDKSGWALISTWGPNDFAIWPLVWQHSDENEFKGLYTPLVYHSHDKAALGWLTDAASPYGGEARLRGEESFTFCCLGFSASESSLALGDWDWLFNRCGSDTDKLIMTRAPYLLKGTKYQPPKNAKEIGDLRAEVVKTLAKEEETDWGFFPLFFAESSTGGDWKSGLLLDIVSFSSDRDRYSWDFLWDIGASYSRESLRAPADEYRYWLYDASTEFNSWALLFSKYRHRVSYRNEGAFKDLKELSDVAREIYWFHDTEKVQGGDFEKFKKALEKIAPGTVVPEDALIDGYTFGRWYKEWRREWCKGKEFPTEDTYEVGSWPLFMYESNPRRSGWYSIVTLSGYSNDATGSGGFFSLPLLSGGSWDANGSGFTTVLTPLVWYSSTDNRPRIHRPIHPRDYKWAEDYNCTVTENKYGLCGLYYRGRDVFSVVKEGKDFESVNSLKSFILNVYNERERITSRRAALTQKRADLDAWVPKDGDREDYLRRELRVEALRREEEELARAEGEFNGKADAVKILAERLGFAVPENWLERNDLSGALNALYDACTEERVHEDVGGGLVYRKEKFYNGDYTWRFLWFLAGGDKTGERESTHILHLLYRYRKEGAKSETVFFPFVSIARDGEDSTFSFLGRVFKRTVRGGKSSGYFLFFPYGED